MRLSAAYGPSKFGLSFELFPPKTPAGDKELFRQLDELMVFKPAYVTCTYGAGGSTRDKTLEIVSQAHRRYGCPVASHLTCVQATKDQLRAYLREASEKGVDNIVALRGDPPKGQTKFQPVEGGLSYANELVTLIHEEFPDFGIAVAGYPETHQEAPNAEVDLKNLKRKVDAGAEIVLTQLFYDNDDFFSYMDRCRNSGIKVPIVPGILPINSLAQIKRIASMCKARLPEKLVHDLAACGEDIDAQREVGIEHASKQVQELIDHKVAGIHFYVLNKSRATATILQNVNYHTAGA